MCAHFEGCQDQCAACPCFWVRDVPYVLRRDSEPESSEQETQKETRRDRRSASWRPFRPIRRRGWPWRDVVAPAARQHEPPGRRSAERGLSRGETRPRFSDGTGDWSRLQTARGESLHGGHRAGDGAAGETGVGFSRELLVCANEVMAHYETVRPFHMLV